ALVNSPIMNAVGRHHSTGRNSKIKIPCPYPAPEIICSVPYVPPDTMKNVAATSGHKVSFATFDLALEIAWVGSAAGSDNVLNFYEPSSSSDSRSQPIATQVPARLQTQAG